MRVLLVEDDVMIGQSVRQGLQQDGFVIDWVRDGESADTALLITAYDALLLDLGLPRRSGLDVLKALRARRSDIPVLVVTARDAVSDRITGLDSGADDYLVKPFDLDELAARLRALHRRHAGRSTADIVLGELRIDAAAHTVTRAGVPVMLSGREFALLLALTERRGAVLSRAQLEQKLYGWDDEVESNTIEVYIHALRRKLGAGLIRNVRGVGYTVVVP